MAKKIKKKNSIIFYFSDKWGEIETALPLICEVKKRKKLKIIIILNSSFTYDQRSKYKDLYFILKKNSHLIISTNSIIKKKLLFLLSNLKVSKNILLDLYSIYLIIRKKKDLIIKQSFFYELINKSFNIKYFCCVNGNQLDQEWFKNKITKFLIIPTAPTFKGQKFHKLRNVSYKEYDLGKKERFNFYKNYPKNTILFVSDKSEKKYYENYYPKNIKIIPLGFTRLEKSWIKLIKKNLKKSKNRKRQILILIGKEWYIGKEILIEKFLNILKLAKKYNYQIKFKYHPRTEQPFLNKAIPLLKSKLIETQYSVMTESLKSDLVISTSKSGVCMDCIVVGVPVVEYYTYNNGIKSNMQNEFIINHKLTSLFKYLGLVFNVDTNEKLKNFFKNIHNDKFTLRKLAKKQYNSLKKCQYNQNKVFETFLESLN